jgi:hypothetical protein
LRKATTTSERIAASCTVGSMNAPTERSSRTTAAALLVASVVSSRVRYLIWL